MIEAVDLGAENDERMARLREALALGDGFQLVIVQVEPGEQREEVLRRLAGWSGRSGVPRLELVRLAPGDSPVMRLAGDHAGVILVGLEADGPDRAERTRTMLAELNWSRDRLPDMVHGPLVLVVSQRVQTALFEGAPDFYSWRMHSTSIAPPPRPLERPLRWFEPDLEDPAELEAMIEKTAALKPPAVRELGRLYARLARARSARGQDPEAEAALDAAGDAYVRAGTLDDRVDLLLVRSDVAARSGRKDEASAWLEKARQVTGAGVPNPQVSTKLLFHEAMHALDRGDFKSAAAVLPSAMEAARTLGDQHKEAALLIGAALLASHLGAMQEEQVLLERAVEQFHGTGQLASEAIALTLLARAAKAAGRSDEAEQYALVAVARAEASGSADAVAESRTVLGRIASDNGHLGLADEILRTEVAPIRMHVNGQLAGARAHLAILRGDDASAEHHLRAALEAYRRGGSPREVADVSIELAELGRRTQNWTLALTGFEAADRLGNSRQRAAAALGLAELALDRGEWTAAIADQLAVAAQMAVSAGDAALADRARVQRGAVLMELGCDAEARMALKTALSGFETRGQAEAAARVRDLLGSLDERGNPRTSE